MLSLCEKVNEILFYVLKHIFVTLILFLGTSVGGCDREKGGDAIKIQGFSSLLLLLGEKGREKNKDSEREFMKIGRDNRFPLPLFPCSLSRNKFSCFIPPAERRREKIEERWHIFHI